MNEDKDQKRGEVPEESAPEPEPVARKKSSRYVSVGTDIVINMSILMITALLLIILVLNWVHNFLVEEYARYARFILIPYILIFGLTVAVFGWRLISRLILKPLHELLQATNQVAGGDLEVRVPVTENNEMGQLAAAFNRMTERLSQNRQELENHLEEMTRLHEHLARTQRELLSSEKLASVGRLAAGVAHEIGNPLSAIAGYLELLTRRKYLEPQDQEMLYRIQEEVKRIHTIIRELLDYSRPQDESLELLDLNASVKSTLTLLQGQKGFEQVSLELGLNDLPLVRANRSSAQQLIMNLVLNAVQAMPTAGRLKIFTRPAEREGKKGVELEIADTGIGIPAENLDRIFDPFFTTKDPGEGTGLGLAICLRITENLKGKISVESEVGKGSIFRVWLPAAEENSVLREKE